MADNVKFGQLLGDYRVRCGWSQEELAKKVGVSRNAIVLWERHERGRQTNTHPQSRGVVLRIADELLLTKEERKGFLEAAGFSSEHWPAEYWNVPYQHNPYFVGREAVLQSLRQTLVPGAKTTALTQSISGLGGIGKTQVAIEYAHRYGEQYEAVLWIQADSQEIVTASYLQLATEVLGLPEQKEAAQQIAKVKSWLAKYHGWLMILDNVEDPKQILSTFIPSKHQGSVLITTRRSDAGKFAHNEVLPLLSEDEAILFLLQRADLIGMNASVTEATADDFFLARDLCQLLDRLPLALDQAGAYIAEDKCSLQSYIDLYQQYRPKLLDRRSESDHPDSVLMTFWLSWDQIQQRDKLAGKALQFCSFLAPDQIPQSLVKTGVLLSERERAVDDLQMNNALGMLHRYSLIERAEPMLSLHRLVQEVMQEVLSEEERQQWMQRAVLAVHAACPDVDDVAQWQACERWLPHALMCADWIEQEQIHREESASLLNRAGYYLKARGRYKETEPLYERALALSEELWGERDPNMAGCLNNLAELYHDQGKYEQAEPLHERALAIREEVLGARHPHTAQGLNNLAELYRARGKYREAEPLHERALAIRQEQLGTSHLDTAQSLNNLALLYHEQGKYEQAEPLWQQALAIHEKELGASHPRTAMSLNNLAELYRERGKYQEAEPLHERALAIRQEQLGTNHPDMAQSLNNLALLYHARGKYEQAEPLFQRALTIREQQLGASHPDTAQSLSNLAALHWAQGHYREAEAL